MKNILPVYLTSFLLVTAFISCSKKETPAPVSISGNTAVSKNCLLLAIKDSAETQFSFQYDGNNRISEWTAYGSLESTQYAYTYNGTTGLKLNIYINGNLIGPAVHIPGNNGFTSYVLYQGDTTHFFYNQDGYLIKFYHSDSIEKKTTTFEILNGNTVSSTSTRINFQQIPYDTLIIYKQFAFSSDTSSYFDFNTGDETFVNFMKLYGKSNTNLVKKFIYSCYTNSPQLYHAPYSEDYIYDTDSKGNITSVGITQVETESNGSITTKKSKRFYSYKCP